MQRTWADIDVIQKAVINNVPQSDANRLDARRSMLIKNIIVCILNIGMKWMSMLREDVIIQI